MIGGNEMSKDSISISARDRLKYLFDEGEFTELDAFAKAGDNLSGVITAYGYVDSNPVYAFAQDVSVNDGALTRVQADKISKIYDMAVKTGLPVVGIYDSFGADLNDGISAMTSYGELILKASNLSGVVPQISVIAGTCAGASAILAVSADFVVMSKSAELFITPNTEVEDLAQNAADNGTASLIAENDKDAIEKAKEILLRLPQNNLSPVPMFEFNEPDGAYADSAENIAKAVCDDESVIELSKDFGKAGYTALASIGGATVGICATNKTNEKLTSSDCSKLARFVRTCDAFAIPIITFVDTEGFDNSECANKSGAVLQMAKLASAYAEATTIKISVITGKAYGPSFITLAGKGSNADMVFAVDNAVISALEPLAAVEFLSHDKLKGTDDLSKSREALVSEYIEKEASAQAAAEKMCVDGVITSSEIRQTLVNAIEIMAGKRVSRLPKKHSNSPF